MREPSIVLLSTYELGHAPMHLASPLGFLKRAGIRARAIDLSVAKLDEAAVAGADLMAVAVPMHTALRLALRLLPRLRALNPRGHICFYGLYAVLHEEHLKARGVDSTLGGEYEAALVELARTLVAPAGRQVVRLAFAPPERQGLAPVERYAKLLLPSGEARPAGYVEASRGCLHLCRHCPIPSVYEGRFFVVPAELVEDDVRAQVRAGARHVTFGDPDFWNGPKHGMSILRALHAEHPKLTFDVTIKVEHLLRHRHLLPELAALGCAFVVSAVESLDDRVLAILDKGHTRQDVDEALDLCDAAGLPLRPSLTPFTPWETLEGYRALLEWIEARDLIDRIEPVHLTIRLLVPPRSKLLEVPELSAAFGPLDADALTHRWRHPDPRMDELQRAAFEVVAADSASGADPRATFRHLRTLADAAWSGVPLDMAATTASDLPPLPGRTPRLSEAWFC